MDLPLLGPRFKVERRLGETSHFEFFAAQQEGAAGFSRRVLLKVLRPALALDRQQLKAFADQARNAAQFAHPNLLHLYDFGEHAGTFFLVTEYLDGHPLTAVLASSLAAQRPLSPGFVAAVGSQVCAALGYAQTRLGPTGAPLALVHRDLNPAVIAACADGTTKLLDFSLARPAGFAAYTEGRRDNLAYASPEQFTPAPVDPRSDLFSLGAVLWELVARRRLATVADPAQLARWICEVPAPRLRTVDPAFPEELAAILERALQIDPAQRFASAAELGRALDGFLGRVGASASEEIRAEVLRTSIAAPAPTTAQESARPAWLTTRMEEHPAAAPGPLAPPEEEAPLELDRPIAAPPPAAAHPLVDPGPLRRHQLRQPASLRRGVGLILALAGAFAAGGLLFTLLRPPAPPAPQPGPATILITSEPSGVAVRIDGIAVGTTPYSAKNLLPPGHHRVQLDKEGFAAAAASIQGGQQAWLSLELQPLHVHTRPPTPGRSP